MIDPESGWLLNYAAMTLLAGCIAALGMRLDSAPIVIGAMLVAPVMRPVLGLSFAVLINADGRTYARLLAVLATTSVALVAIGWLLAVAVASTEVQLANEVLTRTAPDVRDLLVALAAGSVGAFAMLRPRVSDTIPGVAIAVALVPPPVAAGIALAASFPSQATGALVLYGTNLVAIVAGSVVTVLVLRLYGDRPFNLRLPRLAGSAVVVLIVGGALAITLTGAFSEAVAEARQARNDQASQAAQTERERIATTVTESWITSSEQPNLGVVSIAVPSADNAGDPGDEDGTATISIVLLGREDSYIPPLGGLESDLSEAVNQPSAVSIRLVAVGDQVNSRFEVQRVPETDGVDALERQIRATATTWLGSVDPQGLVLDVRIADGSSTVIRIASAQQLDVQGLLDLLDATFTEGSTAYAIVTDTLAVSTPGLLTETEPTTSASILIDGRATERPSVCALPGSDAYRLAAPGVFIHVGSGAMTVASATESVTAPLSSAVTTDRTSVAVAEFPSTAPLDVVEVSVTGTWAPCPTRTDNDSLLRVVGVQAGSELRIRAEPSTASDIVAAYPSDYAPVVPAGDRASSDSRDWIEVDYGIGVGWAAEEFLASLDPIRPEPEPEPPTTLTPPSSTSTSDVAASATSRP